MSHQHDRRPWWFAEDLQLLQETFSIIEPGAARVDIRTHVDPADQCLVIEDISVYDELGHAIPYQKQGRGTENIDNWIEVLLPENLGFVLHCLTEGEASGTHQFLLKAGAAQSEP